MKAILGTLCVWMLAALLPGCSVGRKAAEETLPDRVARIRMYVDSTDSTVFEAKFSYAADGQTIDTIHCRISLPQGFGQQYMEYRDTWQVTGREGRWQRQLLIPVDTLGEAAEWGAPIERQLALNPDGTLATALQLQGEGTQGAVSLGYSPEGCMVRYDYYTVEEGDSSLQYSCDYTWEEDNIASMRMSVIQDGEKRQLLENLYGYTQRERRCNVDPTTCLFQCFGGDWGYMAAGLNGVGNRNLLDHVSFLSQETGNTMQATFVYYDDEQGRVGSMCATVPGQAQYRVEIEYMD